MDLSGESRTWRKGRLGSHQAPAAGELVSVLLAAAGVTIEEIISSDRVDPVPYDQDHDEWVVVLAGRATLEIGGEPAPVDLVAGDWLALPARTKHTVTRTDAGTRWLAVHMPAPPDDPTRKPA